MPASAVAISKQDVGLAVPVEIAQPIGNALTSIEEPIAAREIEGRAIRQRNIVVPARAVAVRKEDVGLAVPVEIPQPIRNAFTSVVQPVVRVAQARSVRESDIVVPRPQRGRGYWTAVRLPLQV